MWDGFAGALLSGGIGLANMAMQKREQRYQREFAENAVSIRAKDLQKAGLSKTLAAGGAANAPTSMAPQMSDPDPIGKMMQASSSKKAKSEADLADSKKKGQDIVNKYTGTMMEEQIEEKRLDVALKNATLGYETITAKNLAESSGYQVRKDYFDAVTAELGPRLARLEISNREKEGFLKMATTALQDVMGREKEWNLQWHKDKNMPTTAGSDPFMRALDRVIGFFWPMIEDVSIKRDTWEGNTETQTQLEQRGQYNNARIGADTLEKVKKAQALHRQLKERGLVR